MKYTFMNAINCVIRDTFMDTDTLCNYGLCVIMDTQYTALLPEYT